MNPSRLPTGNGIPPPQVSVNHSGLVPPGQERTSSFRREELPTYEEAIEYPERPLSQRLIGETDESDDAQSERGMSSVSNPLRGRGESRQVGRGRRRSFPPLRRSTRSRHSLPSGREVDPYTYPIESVITAPTTTHWPLGYLPYTGYPLQPYGGYIIPGLGMPHIPAGGYPDPNGGPKDGRGPPDHGRPPRRPPQEEEDPLEDKDPLEEETLLEEEAPQRPFRSRRTSQ